MMADSSLRTVAGKTERVVVVGAGLAGLSAALHLAGRGRKVTVVERTAGRCRGASNLVARKNVRPCSALSVRHRR